MRGIQRTLISAMLMGLVMSISAANPATAQRVMWCSVSDTSGTPLNVRAAPNGRVITTVANGTEVSVSDIRTDSRGRTWAFISFENRRGVPIDGWVIRRYLLC